MTALSPAQGPVGTVVTVAGSRLDLVNQAAVGGVTTAVAKADAGTLRLGVPMGAPTGAVTLSHATGTVAAGTFTVTAPAMPTGLSGVAGADSATLMWEAVPQATAYRVRWGLAGGALTDSQTVSGATGIVVPALATATRYTFTVEALDAGGTASPPAGPLVLGTRSVVWPISGTTTPDTVAHPFSSTFGPRLKASEAFRYDFHRGVDLPTPLDTPLKAVVAGVVTLAGSSPSYSDGVFQIRFSLDPASSACGSGNCAYVNYLHINGVATNPATGKPWQVGELVQPGDVVAFSGASATEAAFPHLHFEVRVGSAYQKDCVNPLLLLPGTRGSDHGLTLVGVDRTQPLNPQVTVAVTAPPSDLDARLVRVETFEVTAGGVVPLSQQSYDMVAWNRLYTPTTGDPTLLLDDPTYNGVTVAPDAYSASSTQYKVAYTFRQLVGAANPANLRVVVTAVDGEGRVTTVQKTGF